MSRATRNGGDSVFQITFSENDLNEAEQVQSGLADLTKREEEVLRLVLEGMSSSEIAVRLGISTRTAELHRTRIMEKLGARRAVDLVRMILIDQLVLSFQTLSLPIKRLEARKGGRRRLYSRGRRAARLMRPSVLE
jgi:DNA-binding CsgD family transcriptional regulator